MNQPGKTILLGDLNAKNPIWGCRAGNGAGNALYKLSAENNIIVDAPSDYTHYPFRHDHLPDILDIALIKNFHLPIHQQVYDELDSDHVPVIISFMDKPKLVTSPPRLINGKINWDLFQEEINKSLRPPQNLTTEENININVQNFTKAIVTSVHKSTITKTHRPSMSWQQQPQFIINLIDEKHRMRRLWQRTRTREHRTRLNQLTHQVKRELDNHRIQSYRRYISEIEPTDPSMWRVTKRLLRQPTVIPPIVADGQVHSRDTEKSETFAIHLAKTFSLQNDTANNDILIQTEISSVLPANTDDIMLTSPTEIKTLIDSLSTKKAPGHDLIPNLVLKNLPVKAIAFLATIFNACLTRGYFPSIWKHAEIILLHKPGKPASSRASYRPISLLSCLSKLLERIIHYRLDKILKANNLIPPYQFGFQSKHSTTHQLLRLSEVINRGFEHRQHTVVVFLDIQQAFDKVWTDGLIYKLIKAKLPGYLLNILASFLQYRTFCVKINASFSNIQPITAGIPQGSVLGPVLFNLYMSDLPSLEDTTVSMFADDTALAVQNYDINEAAATLQTSLDRLSAWLDRWKLKLNPTKCQAKIFTLRRPRDPNNLIISGEEIQWNPPDSGIKYLGVYLDRKLTFGIHINRKLNECYTRLRILYPIMNRKSPLRIQCAVLLYQSVLRPILTYACPVWVGASNTQIRKLQVIQNKILRIATSAPWFVRNTQIHRETGVPYIADFIGKTTKQFLLKLPECPGANFYQLGRKTHNRRLRKRLPQDVVQSSSDSGGDDSD